MDLRKRTRAAAKSEEAELQAAIIASEKESKSQVKKTASSSKQPTKRATRGMQSRVTSDSTKISPIPKNKRLRTRARGKEGGRKAVTEEEEEARSPEPKDGKEGEEVRQEKLNMDNEDKEVPDLDNGVKQKVKNENWPQSVDPVVTEDVEEEKEDAFKSHENNEDIEDDDSSMGPNKRRKVHMKKEKEDCEKLETVEENDGPEMKGSDCTKEQDRAATKPGADGDLKVKEMQVTGESTESLKPMIFELPAKYLNTNENSNEKILPTDSVEMGGEVVQESLITTTISKQTDATVQDNPSDLHPSVKKRPKSPDIQGGDASEPPQTPAKRARGKPRRVTVTTLPLSVVEAESSTGTPTRSSRRTSQRVVYREPEEDEIEDEAPVVSKSTSKRGKAASKSSKPEAEKEVVSLPITTPRKTGRKGVWDKDVLLTSTKSKLAKAYDLSELLNSTTWGLLNPEEQKECLALLPVIDKEISIGSDREEAHAIGSNFFESNQVFKDSLAEFQEDLVNGRYEPTYVVTAAKAREQRCAGAADKYKDGQYELYWGQKLMSGQVAGAAAMIKLKELVARGLLKKGDIWAFKRSFLKVKPHTPIIIEKEVKVTDINPETHALTFAMPPGPHKFSNSARKDIIIEDVLSPQTVETAILRAHTKTPSHVPNGNAFKVFNIWRNGEDLGVLWEIRQTYWGGS